MIKNLIATQFRTLSLFSFNYSYQTVYYLKLEGVRPNTKYIYQLARLLELFQSVEVLVIGYFWLIVAFSTGINHSST